MTTIDHNSRNVGLAYVQGTNNLVLPIAINPVNKKIRIEVVPRSIPHTAFAAGSRMKIDENSKNVAGAVTDDTDQTITPLTVNLIQDFPCLRVEII